MLNYKSNNKILIFIKSMLNLGINYSRQNNYKNNYINFANRNYNCCD